MHDVIDSQKLVTEKKKLILMVNTNRVLVWGKMREQIQTKEEEGQEAQVNCSSTFRTGILTVAGIQSVPHSCMENALTH